MSTSENKKTLDVFYDKFLGKRGIPVFLKLGICILLGAIFLFIHYFSAPNFFQYNSIFLAAIIAGAMLSLYYATHELKLVIPEMDKRISPKSTAEESTEVVDEFNTMLSTRNFLYCGMGFAVTNCILGTLFGIPQSDYSEVPGYKAYELTLYFGFFLSGFVCGMAVLGIFSVSRVFNRYGSRLKNSIDFTAPDQCGGTLFVGNSLMIFGSITLVVGMLITIYILRTEWSKEGPLAQYLRTLWILFPYAMSLMALLAPAISLNKTLIKYKRGQEAKLRAELHEIKRLIDQPGEPVPSELYERYEFVKGLREQVHNMRTWPYGITANMQFLGVVIVNTYAVSQAAPEELRKIVGF